MFNQFTRDANVSGPGATPLDSTEEENTGKKFVYKTE